ncbi:MAG: hypothetical protein OJF49_003525 [Ktedonobacterales bacterium]|jgi:hypothetical protein|nr:MAG: hypothetical protein OJF49_003525 [Ktedonobacterales bacterium]
MDVRENEKEPDPRDAEAADAATPAEAGDLLTREALAGGPPPERWQAAQRRTLTALTALATVGLVAVLVASGLVPRLLGGARVHESAPFDAARATAQTAYATRSALMTADSALGWVWTGPAAAETFAFAPSAPAIAYTCGVPVPDTTDGFGPIVVWASPDGGATWHGRPTPARDQYCQLLVNPTDPWDVVLRTVTPGLTQLYRSFDGGATWQAFTPPPRATGDVETPLRYMLAWVGDTLFVAPYYASGRIIGALRWLAASAGGAPLRWLDIGVLFVGEFSDGGLLDLAAAGGSLVVEVDRTCSQGSASDCWRLWRTRDGGATWTRLAADVDGNSLGLADGQRNGAAVFAAYSPTPDGSEVRYARSTDGGATWAALPPVPKGMDAGDLVQAPDGDVYAAFWTSVPDTDAEVEVGIYALQANDYAWRLAAPRPKGGGGPLVVSWDAQGRPAALWTNAVFTEPPSAPLGLGLVRHSP